MLSSSYDSPPAEKALLLSLLSDGKSTRSHLVADPVGWQHLMQRFSIKQDQNILRQLYCTFLRSGLHKIKEVLMTTALRKAPGPSLEHFDEKLSSINKPSYI